ncbi:MAG: ISKra4 family transposase [Terriglobales bacterium]
MVDWRSKRLVSLLGEIDLSRTYYYCSQCHTSQLPWDALLGLTARRLTPGAAELTALSGALASFAQAAERILERMSGIRLSESTVQRVTEDAGQRLGQKLAAGETFGPKDSWKWQRDAEGKRCAYLAIDHTGVPQQADGGGKAESRMAAVAMVFNARSEFEEQPPKDPHQVRYLAGFHDLDELGLQWRRQAAEVGWDEAEQQLALTDGAPCLEEFVRKNAPLAVPILDFYHASEHVAELARSLCSGDEAAFKKLQQEWCHCLKHAGGAALGATWQALDQTGWSDAQRECYRQQDQYVRNNLHRMDYPTYLAHGWMIGSGPVEAACKQVVGQRLKGTGMRWREPGSDSLCHLRALFLSQPGQWETFWYATTA